jgi:hypothetical protein
MLPAVLDTNGLPHGSRPSPHINAGIKLDDFARHSGSVPFRAGSGEAQKQVKVQALAEAAWIINPSARRVSAYCESSDKPSRISSEHDNLEAPGPLSRHGA